jgi:hypothetical protein
MLVVRFSRQQNHEYFLSSIRRPRRARPAIRYPSLFLIITFLLVHVQSPLTTEEGVVILGLVLIERISRVKFPNSKLHKWRHHR